MTAIATCPETALAPADLAAEVYRAHVYARAQHATATRHAYMADWARFEAWCKLRGIPSLPASPEAVATFLGALAGSGIKPSTMANRLAAIRYGHVIAGHESPTSSELVRATMKGIRRTVGAAPNRKAAATAERVLAMLPHIPDSLIGTRDRALLLVGFAGAFRRSELVALSAADLEEAAEGLRIHVRRSKTDQEGVGAVVPIIKGKVACPVAALNAWLAAAGIADGPVFRPINRWGTVLPKALTGHAVAHMVKRYAALAGFNPADFSGHSLRAGFATSAVTAGARLFRVMDITRHKSTDTLRGYVRQAEEFKDHAGEGLL